MVFSYLSGREFSSELETRLGSSKHVISSKTIRNHVGIYSLPNIYEKHQDYL